MEVISNVLKRIVKERNLNSDNQKITRVALDNPEVQRFLKEHKDQINQQIITASLPNLYAFTQQVDPQHPDQVIAGYKPELFINGKVIDIKYVASHAKQEQDRKLRAARRIELIDLPNKLRKVELNEVDQTEERKMALKEIASFLDSFERDPHARGLYLNGDFGVGKTYLLAGLANAVARQGKRVVFLHVPSFIASLGSHFSDNSLNDEIDKIASAPVLIFDDIGAETLSEWSRDDVLGVILQKRMDNVLPTFFSSNLDMDDLEKHFSETRNNLDETKAKRLMQRVRFLAKQVFVDGKNRRNI